MALFTNNMRFTGFSGIDTNDMVRQIMNAEAMRLHTMQRQRYRLQWRQQDLRGVNQSMETFRERFLTMTGSDGIHNSSNINSRSTTVTGTGITANATSAAAAGTWQITTNQVAERATMVGSPVDTSIRGGYLDVASIQQGDTVRMSVNGGASREIDLHAIAQRSGNDQNAFVAELNAELRNQFGDTAGGDARVLARLDNAGNISFDTHGTNTLTISAGTDGDEGLYRLGGISDGARNVMAMTTTLGDFFGSGFFTEASAEQGGPRQATLNINGTDVVLNEDMTVGQMMEAVGRDTGATMTFSGLNNTFTLQSRDTGSQAQVSIGGPAGNAFADHFGFDNSQVARGQNAEVTIMGPDGVALTVERETNTFNLTGEIGLTFTVSNAAVGQTANIEITSNTNRTREVITNFVNEYNALVQELHDLRTTPRPRSGNNQVFEPLLPHEREAMSESEIRNWEARSREGMLHRSEEIQFALDNMRRAMHEGIEVDGRTMHLHEFGINMEVSGTLSNLSLDQARLDEALANIPEEHVGEFFRGLQVNLNEAIRDSARRIDRVAGTNAMETTSEIFGQIRNIDDRVSAMQDRLRQREQNLFAMFGRLEAALMQSNAQMDMLWQMSGM